MSETLLDKTIKRLGLPDSLDMYEELTFYNLLAHCYTLGKDYDLVKTHLLDMFNVKLDRYSYEWDKNSYTHKMIVLYFIHEVSDVELPVDVIRFTKLSIDMIVNNLLSSDIMSYQLKYFYGLNIPDELIPELIKYIPNLESFLEELISMLHEK